MPGFDIVASGCSPGVPADCWANETTIRLLGTTVDGIVDLSGALAPGSETIHDNTVTVVMSGLEGTPFLSFDDCGATTTTTR